MKGKYLRMMREVVLGPYPQVDLLVRQGRVVARKHSLLILTVAFAALAGLGAVVAGSSSTVLAANTVPGLYELSFDTTGPVPLTNNRLPVGQELVLKAHVQDASGNPAQRGEVIFQDCEVKNSPGPSAACDSGSGVWAHVFQMSVDASGNASVDYGFVSTPRTIGFRFRYLGQGSSIANGVSNSGDVTWF
jgi:hypothetical protein